MDFQHILEDIYLKLNQCRLHPKQTSDNLTKLQPQFQKGIFRNKYKTRQGVTALNNLIQDLANRQPLNRRLKWSFALHMAADQQASILGQYGLFTTEGSKFHMTLPQRIKKYAIIKGRLSEVYQFGGKNSQQVLQQLLIDDGLSSRKRRNTLLDPIFNFIGIGCSYHQSNQACTVIILAEDIISLVASEKNGQYRKRNGIETGKQNITTLSEQKLIKCILGKAIISNIQNPVDVQNSKNNSQNNNFLLSLTNKQILNSDLHLKTEVKQKNTLHLDNKGIQPTNNLADNKNKQETKLQFIQPFFILSNNNQKQKPASTQTVQATNILNSKMKNQITHLNPPQISQPIKQVSHPSFVQKREGSVVIYQPNNLFYHPSLIKSGVPSEGSQIYRNYDSKQFSSIYRGSNSLRITPQIQQSIKLSNQNIPLHISQNNKQQSKCSII